MENETQPEIESDQSAHDWEGDDERDLRKEIIESLRTRSRTSHEPLPDDVVYEDDYTESTASIGSSISASVESIEQFINSVRSATNTTNSNTTAANSRQLVNDELETYHPRMEVRALSPYRTPEPGQATVILNKPVPLPDPDIKPKSILKSRTSNESNVNEFTLANEEKASSPPPSPPPTQHQTQVQPQTQIQAQLQAAMAQIQTQTPSQSEPQPVSKPTAPKRTEKEKRSFLNLFSKKTTSTENSKNRPVESVVNEEKKPIKAVENETDKERGKLKTRQESVEENKVEQVAVIDHYSDIVREMGSRDGSRPPSRTSSYVPLYMSNHALREAAARADEEEREFAKQQNEQSPYMSNEINKLNINEDEDVQFMLEVAKKMNLYTESNEYESKSLPEVETETEADASSSSLLSPQPQSDLVEISVEHTKSVSYAVRQIKKPDAVAPNHAVGTVFHANAKSLTESTKLKSDCDGNNSVIDTKRHDTLTKVKSAARPFDRKSISEQQRRSKSKSPISGGQRKTSLSQTVLKVTRMPIEVTNNDIDIDLPPSQSQSPSPEPRCKTPEQMQVEADVETNIRSTTLSFTINMMMFVMACWLYIFYDARYSVPFLAVMVWRYARDIIVNKWHKWTKRKTD